MKKELVKLITPLIIISFIIVAIIIINNNKQETSSEIAKCIGKNSELYMQAGCPHCILQEQEFGKNIKYLNITDCFYEEEKCIQKGINHTPTWVISEKTYIGFQSLETLQNLTGC